MHVALDHALRRWQQHHLFEGLRPRQQQAGAARAGDHTHAQHHGAVFGIDLAQV
jgi:hypothetical protein